jgi:hypothetical protein
MALEKLYRALVFLGRFAGIKRAEVSALVRLQIDFARVESILAGFNFLIIVRVL